MAMALQAKYSPLSHSRPYSPSFYPLLLEPQTHSSSTSRVIRIEIRCSHHTIQAQLEVTKTRKKVKPSFFEQIRHKWSRKMGSPREKLPWQEQEQEQEHEEVKIEEAFGVTVTETDAQVESPVSEPVSFASRTRFVSAPWAHGNNFKNTRFGSRPESRTKMEENGDNLVGCCEDNVVSSVVEEVKKPDDEVYYNKKLKIDYVKMDTNPIELSRNKHREVVGELKNVHSLNEKQVEGYKEFGDSNELPWKRERDLEASAERRNKSNTELAERMIPEHELQRLRNVSLRMLERFKVGSSGISQALVDSIHQKWRLDEVVKLKFEEPHSLNMKRTHEILESRTGGLVVWRSGSSVVLFRGMAYNLPCIQSFTKQNQMQQSEDVTSENVHNVDKGNSIGTVDPYLPESAKYLQNLSKEELMDLTELNYLLDELGPRFKDWPGREPLPVDADLLPPLVPGYKPPFRLLPHGIRQCLRDSEMTMFRRLARVMPPHFALGRNRELEGLAKAMSKLWEKSAIAKIAIKRGVLNTRNERMAEELKKLTGGTLLSRNKDYIVFYRGNDFLPPALTETLKERSKLADIRHDEEEQARQLASSLIESKGKTSKGALVAGTLSETIAATSRWGQQPSSKNVEEMIRDSTLTRHATLLRYLKKKLVIAKQKLKKADLALAKVQENLDPAEIPSDLETITNEERFLFRKMGLSMKPYLLLGRRGVYAGTIENMHLHWKYRELVKIIVKGKSFRQVKQIAIALEAESGGVLVSIEKTPKGIAIIVYRGKNYVRPLKLRPENLLTGREALAQSVELQRREGLKHNILDLEERIELVKSELEEMKAGKKTDVDECLRSRLDDACFSNDDTEEVEGEETSLETYDSSNEGNYNPDEF